MSAEFDQNNIDSIKDLMKDNFATIIETYTVNARKYIDAIGAGIRDEDSKAIENNAHPLKSSSGMMGLSRVRELAEQIEEQAVEGIDDYSENGAIYNLYTDLDLTSKRGFEKLNDEVRSINS